MRLTPRGFSQGRVQPVNVRLNLLATALVNNFPPHHGAGVRAAIASRRQFALHIVDTLAEHDLYSLGALAQHYDVNRLTPIGHAYLDLLCVH